MQPLCRLEDIPPGGGREFVLESPAGPRYLALLDSGDGVRAYLNACPHQGRNLSFAPDEFLFDPDGRLICPHHGACFDVSTGECLDGPCKGASLTPVDVHLRDGMVYLRQP